MKKILTILAIIPLFIQLSCVQKTRKVTIHLKLRLSGMQNISIVGIRGNGKPLSWDKDVLMQPLIKDSVYTATINTVTGYNFCEIKFTVNGKMELDGQPNRRINFKATNEVSYNAAFDNAARTFDSE